MGGVVLLALSLDRPIPLSVGSPKLDVALRFSL